MTVKIPLRINRYLVSILLLISILTTTMDVSYSTSINNFLKNGIKEDNPDSVMSKFLDDSLDQFQITWNGAVSVATPDALAQSFKPSVNMLTRVQILTHKSMVPSGDVKLSIRKDINGSDLTSITLTSELIPTTRTWVEFDFENISLIPNDIYYIVWTPLDINMSYLWWGYDNNNFDSYPKGEAWLCSDGVWTTEGFVFKDWCFKTYGYHASLPPSTPTKPIGPTEGLSWHVFHYETNSMDPDGDDIRYGWDWDGDDVVDEWSEYYPCNETVNMSHSWDAAGTFYVKVKAEDMYRTQSPFSDSLTVNITNDPPMIPIKPNGASYTLTGLNNTFSTRSLDPEADDIRYGWDWDGDDVVDEWSEYYPSNVTVNMSHSWDAAGTFYVKVKAEDMHGAQSGFSNKNRVIVINMDNDPPDKPQAPQGPSMGLVGISYSYSSSTNDPNGDWVYYQFDWDDGTRSDWVGSYTSGQMVTMSHIWDTKGSFQVKVKAKDSQGLESVWSDPLPITMPKSKITLMLFQQLYKTFPDDWMLRIQ